MRMGLLTIFVLWIIWLDSLTEESLISLSIFYLFLYVFFSHFNWLNLPEIISILFPGGYNSVYQNTGCGEKKIS